jgi:hypothetical protein
LAVTLRRAHAAARRADPDAAWRRFGYNLELETTAFWESIPHATPQWRSDETIAWVVLEVQGERDTHNAREAYRRITEAEAERRRVEAEHRRTEGEARERWSRADLKQDPAFRRIVESRSIEAAFHWTPLRSLGSVLKHGIRPRARLDESGIAYEPHSYGIPRKVYEFRHHVAISIHPQKGMMWRADDPVLLALDPRALALEGAFYAPENTASAHVEFAAIRLLTAAAYLDALFREPGSRELIDWQAEVWIPGGVPADLIRAVFLVNENPIEAVRVAIAAMDVPRRPDVFIDPDLNGNLPFDTLDL